MADLHHQGEIWANLPAPAGWRPVLLLTREPAVARRLNVTVAPLTRTRRGIASEVPLTPADGVPTDCVVSCDDLRTIPKRFLARRVAALSPERMQAAFDAIRYALGMP